MSRRLVKSNRSVVRAILEPEPAKSFSSRPIRDLIPSSSFQSTNAESRFDDTSSRTPEAERVLGNELRVQLARAFAER